jgi:hypothetical protein
MDKPGQMKMISILLGMILVLHAIMMFANRKDAEPGFTGQHMIMATMYIMLGLFLAGAGFNLDP